MNCRLCGKDSGKFYGCVCNECYVRRVKERQKRNYDLIMQSKQGKPCQICGVVYPPVCMDYHHPNALDKEFGIGGQGRDMAPERILKEIDKCILVCANCHRTIHYCQEEE